MKDIWWVLFYKKIHSQLVGIITRMTFPKWFVQFLIRRLIAYYRIELKEICQPISEFKSLNAFFTRKIDPSYRPICEEQNAIASPADSLIQQFGDLRTGKMIQAKGFDYTVDELIPSQLSKNFHNGRYITFYLSPKDCHLIFSPLKGTIVSSVHVPGSLYLVRDAYIKENPSVYTQSERVIIFIYTNYGLVAVVLVGAMRVGNITTVYDTSIQTNSLFSQLSEKKLNPPCPIERGSHLATFNLGSTVILLFEEGTMDWADNLSLGQSIKYGSKIGTIIKDKQDE